MSFKKQCGPCHGSGYYGFDPKATCKVCNGARVLELPGTLDEYAPCSPCHGSGNYGFVPSDTCVSCSGTGLVPKNSARFVPVGTDRGIPHAPQLHPEIERVSGKLFRDRHYRNAALDAYIRVIDEVKRRSGRPDLDGDDLMGHALGCDRKTPALRFNDLATESDRNEQKGMMFLFKAVVGLRNSKAHSNDVFDDPIRAYEYLTLASLLMRLLEIAIRTESVPAS